jgi:hypothetical protein
MDFCGNNKEIYILFLENREGDSIFLEGKVLDAIHFPFVPLGGEKIILYDSPSLFDYFKMRANPAEELQRRFSERTYTIKESKFEDEKILITAIEE